MHNHEGLLYIATGDDYVNEAINNMQRSRPFIGSRKSCIVTDRPSPLLYTVFDIVKKHPFPTFSYEDKILPLLDLPFKRTLFLDTDACLISPIDDLFKYSCSFSVAAVTAPVRHPPGWTDPNPPLTFPEYNTGVLFLQRSYHVHRLILNWLKLYRMLYIEHGQLWDQASFRSCLWKKLQNPFFNLCTLPAEVNLRTTKPWIAGRGMPVYVVHGRYPESEHSELTHYLNCDIDRFRTWVEWINMHPYSSIQPRFDRTYI